MEKKKEGTLIKQGDWLSHNVTSLSIANDTIDMELELTIVGYPNNI